MTTLLAGAMDGVIGEPVTLLRDQMLAATSLPESSAQNEHEDDEDDEDDEDREGIAWTSWPGEVMTAGTPVPFLGAPAPSCRRDAGAPRLAGETPALPGLPARRRRA